MENTNKARNILTIAAYVLLMTLFFFGGYAVGGIEQKTVAVVSTPQPKSVQAAASIQEPARYELILINSELFLYKNTSNSHELLYSHPITENIFPKEDTDELKKGLYFEKLEDAQSLLENFVS